MPKLNFCIVTAAIIGILFGAPYATAASFPDKPVKIVAPTTPGGGLDLLARILSPHLSEKWGQPVVVDDRPGAGGILGSDFVARSAPDGYTLLVVTTGFSNNPFLYKTIPYKTPDAFAPITIIATNPNVLVVSTNAPFKSVKEMVDLAKKSPESISFGSSGVGTGGHLVVSLLQAMTGTKLTHIPYKGAGASITGVVSGEVQLLATAIGPVLPYIQSKSVIPIAVTGPKRSRALPDVPYYEELGIKSLDHDAWQGLFAPAGTPPDIIDKIYKDVVAVLKIPSVASQLDALGYDVDPIPPADFATYLKDDIVHAGESVKAAGIKPE